MLRAGAGGRGGVGEGWKRSNWLTGTILWDDSTVLDVDSGGGCTTLNATVIHFRTVDFVV